MTPSSLLEPSTLQTRWRRLLRQPWWISFFLLLVAIGVNFYLQPNFFHPIILSGNLRTFLPLMLLAAGQAIVILGGGIDLSIGSIVTLVDVVIVQALGSEPGIGQMTYAIGLGFLTGMAAGGLNGICVAFLRFQPIVATFASNSVFAGLALFVMPQSTGRVPMSLTSLLRYNPLSIPLTIWVAAAVLLAWVWLYSTRYGSYLYAVGGDAQAAFVNGVPVRWVRFSTYVLAGLVAGLSGFVLVLSTGTGDPLVAGLPMMLSSIVAVVIGGTALSGGYGGVAGSMMGAVILGLIRNIIFFANIPNWYQTLVDGLIIMLALAGPGLVDLIRGKQR